MILLGLKRFREVSENKRAYLKYLSREPFYSLYDINNTFADCKVVWDERAKSLSGAVIGLVSAKCIIPDSKVMLIGCEKKLMRKRENRIDDRLIQEIPDKEVVL